MKTTPQNHRAIEKAKRIKCSVHVLPNRSYLVTTPRGHRYTVKMLIHDGERYALCNCAAGAVGTACYHCAVAANVDDLRFDGRTLARSIQTRRAA